MRSIGMLLFTCGLLFCGNVRAEISEEIKKIPIGVESLFKCGSWKEKDVEGFNRFILAYVDGHSEVFAQWIDVGVDYSSGHDDKLVESIPIEEFTGHAAYSIGTPRCKTSRSGGGIFVFEVRNANEENGLYKVELSTTRVGSYKLQWKEIGRSKPKRNK